VLFYQNWKTSVAEEIKSFQSDLLKAIKDGYEGQQKGGQEQWSFSGAFLFSLTVISTIGKFLIDFISKIPLFRWVNAKSVICNHTSIAVST